MNLLKTAWILKNETYGCYCSGKEFMSTSVLPYAKVLQEGEEIDYVVIRFTGFNSNILVHEEYCVNPGCSCADAVLTFIELSEDGKPLNDWFVIRLDMSTWKVKADILK